METTGEKGVSSPGTGGLPSDLLYRPGVSLGVSTPRAPLVPQMTNHLSSPFSPIPTPPAPGPEGRNLMTRRLLPLRLTGTAAYLSAVTPLPPQGPHLSLTAIVPALLRGTLELSDVPKHRRTSVQGPCPRLRAHCLGGDGHREKGSQCHGSGKSSVFSRFFVDL